MNKPGSRRTLAGPVRWNASAVRATLGHVVQALKQSNRDISSSMFDQLTPIVRTLLERLLVVWLVLISLVAFWWPSMRLGTHFDPFIGSQAGLQWIIAVTMLAIGSLLPRDEIRQVMRRWPTVLGGTTVQYVTMPLLAYVVGRAMGFEGSLLTGIVVVGCVPGAMASNVLTLAARANVSYSVSLTTSATLFSPLLVPLALKLTLGQWREFPAWSVGLTLLWTVVIPVVVGHLLSRWSPTWNATFRSLGSIVANLTILWIIAVVVAVNRDRLNHFHLTLLLALSMINLGGYLAGFLGGKLMRLPRPMRRALTLEVGMQNAGLGTFLLLAVFKNEPEATIPTAIYTFGCMLTGTVLARIWAEWGCGDAMKEVA
ncbi:MAG: bile acid:sodium symporter family protein [Pirellulales bacterium]|nr:bile acid:sodium symporter family protein [Pirellulales bacterium]